MSTRTAATTGRAPILTPTSTSTSISISISSILPPTPTPTSTQTSTSSGDSYQTKVDVSVKAFTSALLFYAVVALAIFVAFCIVRHWSKKIYQPRTYLVPEDIRSPELPPGVFSWITASFKVKDTELLQKVGLDAYMFLRFLRMSAMFFAGCMLLAVPILIPISLVNGVGDAGGVTGLPTMTLTNVGQGWRLWFHLVLTYIFCGAAILLLWREMQEYTRRRHAYFLSEKHARMPQSTTILVTGIPKGLNSEAALFDIFNGFPGGIAKIWLNMQPKDLLKLCKERDHVVAQLEMAEYNFVRSAYRRSRKDGSKPVEPRRPIGRISSIPFVGDKVDLIEHYTERLCHLNQVIEQAQQSALLEPLNSAFIQFHNQFAAHSAVQTVVHPVPFRMTPMFAEVSPLDVVWENMNLGTLIRKGRHMIIVVVATVLVLLLTIPTITIAGFANINKLIETLPFLEFLRDYPKTVVGIIQGILPPLLIIGLMSLLPIVLTAMAQYEGHERHTAVMLSVMSRFFMFLVVNVLLISTLSAGILPTIRELEEKIRNDQFSLTFIANRISESLAGASTFFVTYVLLQSFTGPVLELLQIGPLLLNFLFVRIFNKSPRQIWDVQGRLMEANYGIIFPPAILVFCIGIVYATVAPLILPFVTLYFTLYYFVFRHQFLYVYHQPIETGGLAFPRAVKHTYTGIFISEITLFSHFLLKLTSFQTVPQLVLLLILILVTAMSLSNMNQAFDPLVVALPIGLFSKVLHVDKEGIVTDGSEPSKTAGYHDSGAKMEHGYERLSGGTGISMDNLEQRKATLGADATAEMKPNGNTGGQEETPSLAGGGLGPSKEQELKFRARSSRPFSSEEDHRGYLQNTTRDSLAKMYSFPLQPQLHEASQGRWIPERQQEERLTGQGQSTSFWRKSASFHDYGHAQVPCVDQPGSLSPGGGTGEAPHARTSPVSAELEYLQDQAFCHPAIYSRQIPVWLPLDERGLMQGEINKLRQRGIVVATDGAVIDGSTGKARVSGLVYAPGEESRYRLERGE
ncbi:hypothetical protein BGZ72_007853 [Mortierella alpina]|nr:hypothetical protein BGZ72_007853 [Mortierella alpina]